MIIKSFRVPTTESLGRLRDHVFRGGENAAIHVLHGCEADLSDFRNLAVECGSTYALRHFIIAPGRPMSVPELMAVVDDLSEEFGFDRQLCVVILHRKARREGEAETHLHVLVPEVDAVTGGVLSSSHDFVRHEKIARIVEHRCSHPFVQGAHLPAVMVALIKEGRHAVYKALATAFPGHCRPVEAFSTVNAKRVAREVGLDLAALKIELRCRWKREASVSAIASWLLENSIDLTEGDTPGTIVLSKGEVHIAALHRLLGLRKEVLFREFQLASSADAARQPLAQQSPAEPCTDDSSRNSSNPLVDRRGDLAAERGRRKRRRRSDPFDPRSSSSDPEGAQGDEGVCRSAAPAPRTAAPSRRRRDLEARLRMSFSDNDRTVLQEQKRLAKTLAVGAHQAVTNWLDERLKEIEAEEASLKVPEPHQSAVLIQARRNQAVLQQAIESHRRDIAKAEKALLDAEIPSRTSLLRGWKKQTPSPDMDDLRASLVAAKSRLAESEKIRSYTAATYREERQRIESRRDLADQLRPSKLSSLSDCRQTIEILRREVARSSAWTFGGPSFYRSRFDQIQSELKGSRLNERPTDYTNRTDMWGIGQLRTPL